MRLIAVLIIGFLFVGSSYAKCVTNKFHNRTGKAIKFFKTSGDPNHKTKNSYTNKTSINKDGIVEMEICSSKFNGSYWFAFTANVCPAEQTECHDTDPNRIAVLAMPNHGDRIDVTRKESKNAQFETTKLKNGEPIGLH